MQMHLWLVNADDVGSDADQVIEGKSIERTHTVRLVRKIPRNAGLENLQADITQHIAVGCGTGYKK
ncbi:hypothetical protein GCM10025868_11240 [Angustibacter aerolatus]|uniref:Uncharacterized protein n=1 Tax=Angustibacter aerolatus TaxID=1162965 RepID=A0ABQ6JDJ7_9ACTN|nr:hypothetical protein [Angustibacter aerolatus]GMA85874.1 hypothetical protein GCM10025868_11240 [Angustibacter aerolatus]